MVERARQKRSRRGRHRRRSTHPRRDWAVKVGGAVAPMALLVVVLSAVTSDGERLVALGGPSGLTSPARGHQPGTSAEASPAPPPVTPAVHSPTGPSQPQAVTLAFAGDVHFEGQVGVRLEADPSTVLAEVAPLLQAADVAVVNLETAVTSRGAAPNGKEFAFRAPGSALTALKAAGVDVASMANNHGMDFGREGLDDSLAASTEVGLPLIGIGRTATEAYRPFLTVVRGQRIAVIGATQVLDDDLRVAWTATDSQPGLASAKEVGPLTEAVRAARAVADTVVVYLHWGVEGQSCPSAAQAELAQQLADAGADVVVGGHAHRLQGAGRLGTTFVAYGLGNFAFATGNGPGADTGVLTLAVTGRTVTASTWAPARIVGHLPRLLGGKAAEAASAAWERLRGCTGLRP